MVETAVPASDVTVALVGGRVRPGPGRPLQPEDVRRCLREAGVLAVVGVRPSLGPESAGALGTEPVELAVATDAAGRAYVLRGGVVEVGPDLADVAARLQVATGGAVELEESAVAQEPDGGATTLVSRTPLAYLPEAARRMRAPVRAAQVGGWTVAELGAGGDPWRYGWTAAEFPVAHLHRDDGARRLTLVTARGRARQAILWSAPRPVPTFAPAEVGDASRGVFERLMEPERSTEEMLRRLLSAPRLADVEGPRLREALATSDDGGWYGRVLDALGMPVLAGDVAEGRADLSAVLTVEPASLWSTLVQVWDLTVDAAVQQGRRARGLQWWHRTLVRHPPVVLLTVALQVAFVVLGTAWVAQHPGGAFPVVIAVVCVLMAVDAVVDVATAVRARRRWRGRAIPD